MIAVTSFSTEGHDKYGRHFLKFAENFPGKIILYTEAPIVIEAENVEQRNFFEIDGVAGFLQNIKAVPAARGLVDGRYNFQFDIYKFCRKMFCQYDAFKEGGKVFWLDGDVEIKKAIPESFLEDVFDGEHIVFMGRKDYYTESGVVGFDTDHADFPAFEKRYKDVLREGHVFTFKIGWHDCYCFDWAREGKGKDLSPDWRVRDSLDVIKTTVLNEYMRHRKGNQKNEISNP